MEKLIDSLISPIILYGAEIWGIGTQFRNSDPYEKLHTKFIKEILGVHCKATNSGCLAELNRIPLYTNIQISAIKYLLHIVQSNNCLAQKVFQATEATYSWTTNVKKILNLLGFNFLTFSPLEIKHFLHSIKERIRDVAIQNQNTDISQNCKLDFFRKIYKQNQRPPYVDLC